MDSRFEPATPRPSRDARPESHPTPRHPLRPLLRTFLGLAVVTLVIGGAGSYWLYRAVVAEALVAQQGANRRQAERVARLLEEELAAGAEPRALRERLQRSLEASEPTSDFLCLLSDRGEVLCHPEAEQVGRQVGDRLLLDEPGGGRRLLAEVLGLHRAAAGILRPLGGGRSEVVYQEPVAGAPWTVSVHADAEATRGRATGLLARMARILGPTLLLLIAVGTVAVRGATRSYERRIEEENRALEARVREQTEGLHQAQKMEALALLAGGVAHDFNNLLTVIRGHLGLLRSHTPPGAASHLDAMERAVEGGSELIRKLLTLRRQGPRERCTVELDRLVEDLGDLLDRVLGRSIRVRLDLPHDLRPVRADPGEIEQVLLNLVVNARDAMPHGGELRLTAGNVPGPPGGKEDRVRLEVSDTGTGIPEEIRERIFDPFFTTKAPETGTGLGLASAHAIVVQHGGTIEVESSPGRGSTFTVELPADPGTGLGEPAPEEAGRVA